MTDLGPAPATPLQPLRPADRDPRERQQHAASHKASSQVSPQRDPDPESVADFEKGDETHQLDERA
jgi:hypothetical protein